MIASAKQTLAALFDKRQVAFDPAALITYEVDAGYDRGRPDGVFFPESADDVARLMRWAAQHGVPLVARGAGTGLSGGAVPEHGGIVISFARMNQVLELDITGRTATVEAGVVNLAFDGLVKQSGLYYPPDPSSGRSSVIGGNIGENAGGPHCFKYGVTTNYVTGLEVVLADGQIVKLGGHALDYPTYDLTGLMVGSEGTLGVVTRADLRLMRNPTGVKTMMVAFNSQEEAGVAVSAVIAAGLMPATLEMMDQRIMRIIESFAPVGLPIDAKAALIVEVDGYPQSLDGQMEEIADILSAHGGFGLRIAQSEAERAQIWYGRKSAAGSLSRLAPNFYLVDITVPRSRLADTLAAVNEVCDRYSLTVGHVFHAGDGNLHPAISFDARDEAVKANVFKACEEIVALCIERDGSLTGEHGVGLEKRAYMPMQYSGAELAAMTDIKAVFDPQTLLNPGKIFPDVLPPAQREAPTRPPGAVFAPATVQEAAAGLAGLSAAGKTVRIGSAAQGEPHGADVWVSSAAFNGVSTFAPHDLYVTAGAGTRLADLQAFLAPHGMQVPLTSPWPDATLGGLVAANVNAPRRMRYGGVRDLLLATTVALADGRVIRAGRPVVKNVAGYDLTKLFVGSAGTLGLLTDVTLKLLPEPRARRTFALPVARVETGLAWAAATVPAWLVTAGVLLVPGASLPAMASEAALVYTLEGLADDVAAEWAEITALLAEAGAPAAVEIAQTTTDTLWAEFVGGSATAARVGLPPGHIRSYLHDVDPAARRGATWCFDVGNALLYANIAGESEEIAAWLDAAHAPAQARGGYATLMASPHTSLRGETPSAGRDLMRALKACWDPVGILNPGEFILDA